MRILNLKKTREVSAFAGKRIKDFLFILNRLDQLKSFAGNILPASYGLSEPGLKDVKRYYLIIITIIIIII